MKILRCFSLLPLALAAAYAQSTVSTPIPVNPADVVARAIEIIRTRDAQVPNAIQPVPPLVAVAAGETALTLGTNLLPASRVTVPAGETLRVEGPFKDQSVQWTKNGTAIPGATSNTLLIKGVNPSDAGVYEIGGGIPTLNASTAAQQLILGVGRAERLINVSMRGQLAAGPGQVFITGFVVSGAREKKLLVRAVGPSLTQFGVTDALAKPVLRVFRGDKPYDVQYAYPAYVGGPTSESDLADALAKTGAFATPRGSADAVRLMPFAEGAYTVQVTSGDETGGTVLLEVYEVP